MAEVTTEQMIWNALTAHTGIWSMLAYGAVSVGWAWYIAVQKNRWWFEGFLMGATLGPLGVIAAACMPSLDLGPAAVPSSLLRSRDDDDDDKMIRYRERLPLMDEKRYTDEERAKRTPGQARKPGRN